SWSFTR
ncbi:hypothetical protein ACTFIW_000903, partial [Dictyostelium discoideum]